MGRRCTSYVPLIIFNIYYLLIFNVDGEGTLTYAAGHTYVGEWRGGKRTGTVCLLLSFILLN